jgi:glycosyltransferase involved in cell wall biosynthesis
MIEDVAHEERAAPLPSISVVLPAYNEEALIADTVRNVAKALHELGVHDAEIIVVNDGSSDRTAERAQAAAPDANVRVISHPLNRGYGAALRTGFNAAVCEATWLLDSDGQFNPLELARLLPKYRSRCVVAGYRLDRKDGFVRQLNRIAFFSVVRVLLGSTVRDVDCAFKLFPAEVGKNLRCDGAMISTELLLRAKRSGYRLIEVGVHHYPRTAGTATGANPRVIARAFRELFRLWRNPRLLRGMQPPTVRLNGVQHAPQHPADLTRSSGTGIDAMVQTEDIRAVIAS